MRVCPTIPVVPGSAAEAEYEEDFEPSESDWVVDDR